MQSSATTPEQYLEELPPDRKAAVGELRKSILDNLPEGFQETMAYGMIGYVVPHSSYPGGYHAKPEEPLPFISIASQKNHIALYHMGLYSNAKVLDWFLGEYAKASDKKIDMGKGCIRFNPRHKIPYALIAALVSKISMREWITSYEEQRRLYAASAKPAPGGEPGGRPAKSS